MTSQPLGRRPLRQAVLLRHHFQKALGVSPAAYRRTFRGSDKDRHLDLHDVGETFGARVFSR
ncbi:hypothetical protein [Arthrobacter sp. TMS2-4]